MAKNKKSKGKLTNIKETILLLIAIVIISFVLYKVINLIIKPTNTFMIENGTISKEESLEGYIIRQETVIKGNNYKNGLIQIKGEGDKVSVGTEIFRYYASDEKSINEKISETNEKIQEALRGQNSIFSSDVKSIEGQIDIVLKNIKNQNNIQEIQEYKKDIDTYMTKKAKILGGLNSADTHIDELIREKENYQNLLNENSETMKATMSGIISYRIDGLENVLNPNDFSKISEEKLNSLNLKTGQTISTSNEEAKIVNNYYCYIVAVVKSEEVNTIKIGQKIRIRLSTNEEISSVVEFIKEEESNKKVVILKIKKDVEYLINYRKISFEIIWWDETGLKVPNSSIIYDNGQSYVIRNRLGYLNKILIKVQQTNGVYSIIDNYDSDELKEIGYTAEEINKMKSITLYDEILVKPDTENL